MAKIPFIPAFLAIFSGLLSTSPLVAAASTVNLEKRYTNLGCYTDSAPRVLHYGMPTPSSPMTPDVCISYCTSSGFALAGVEYGSECYCGNGFLYDYGQSQSCNMPCQGDAQQTCGGPNAIRIYATGVRAYTRGPASAPSLYNGWLRTQCWQDDMWQYGGNRILRHWPATPILPEQMTIDACINGCGAAGYTSAGVEWGQECWCGNVTYPLGQSTEFTQCNMPCLGDASQLCGAPNRIIIYHNQLVVDYF